MEDVAKRVSFTDPISAIFELNEDLMKRVGRLTYLIEYAHLGGAAILLISAMALLIGFFNNWSTENLIFVGLALGASLLAWWWGRQESRFLDEYLVRSSAVARAKNWEPHPKLPTGSDPLNRFLKYLQDQDERFARIYAKKPEKLEKNAQIAGKSGKTYRFDAYFRGWIFGWRVEPIVIFVRLVPAVRIKDVREMKAAVEDIFAAEGQNGPVRAFLIQTQGGDIAEDVLVQANEHVLEYERTVGGKTLDWSSPVEVLAEDPSGVYNIGSFYFG